MLRVHNVAASRILLATSTCCRHGAGPAWEGNTTARAPLSSRLSFNVFAALGKLANRLRIGPGKGPPGRLPPGEPLVIEMLPRRERDLDLSRHFHCEHVFGVVGHAGRVAVAPVRVNLVTVLLLPIRERVYPCVDPGLFLELANSRFLERLTRDLTAGNRLPETRTLGALNP